MAIPNCPPVSPEAIQANVERVVPAYRVFLDGLGYSAGFVSDLARTARHMMTWLTVSRTALADLDIRGVDDFLNHACTCPAGFRTKLNRGSRRKANRVLEYLIETGQSCVPTAITNGGELVEAFADSLTAQGYSESTVRKYRWTGRHLVVWLYRAGLSISAIDGDVLGRFLSHECTCSHPQFLGVSGSFRGRGGTGARLAKLASFLIEQGVVADWRTEEPKASRGAHAEDFLDWLRRHRGLRDSTLRNTDYCLRWLLSRLGDCPETLDAAAIRAAILTRAESVSHSQVSSECTVLRSYLRFLAANGQCRPGLVDAVPSIARQHTGDLPRYVEQSVIEKLIDSCDTATPIGLRDRAVLVLLARLALRSGDITALRLGDVDWEHATVRLGGKSRRSSTLPLPQDAGDTLAEYILQARPRSSRMTVFLNTRAPHRGLSTASVRDIVRRAMKRAGVDGTGLPVTHLFRHSRATHLLRSGTSPEAVAALLRHQSVETTALYARVDVPMLLQAAQPWPEVVR